MVVWHWTSAQPWRSKSTVRLAPSTIGVSAMKQNTGSEKKSDNLSNPQYYTYIQCHVCRYMYMYIIMYYSRKRYLPSSSMICTTIMSVGSITLSPSLVTVTPNISTQFSGMMSSTMDIGAQITLGPPAVNVSSGIAKKSSVTV